MAFVELEPGSLLSARSRALPRSYVADQQLHVSQSKEIGMNNNVVRVLLLSLMISLPACIDETGEAESTTADESALKGGPWTWTNTATLRCLDSDAFSHPDGTGSMYTLPCNGGNNQRWTNTPLAFGDMIRDLATGWCLDSGGLDDDGRGHAYTLPCNGGSYQQWTVTLRDWAGYEIRNVATQWCLDSNTSGSVYTLPCNNGNFQRWR